MKNIKIKNYVLIILTLSLLTSCSARTGFINKGNFRSENVQGLINRSHKALDDGDIELCRGLNKKALRLFVDNEKSYSQDEYQELQLKLAMLTFRAAMLTQRISTLEESDMFPLIFNSRVERWKNYYITGGREHFSRYLDRAAIYIDMVKEILKEEELPRDLAYVVIVESGYYPFARSRAGAVGLWQFMEKTAKMKGLKINYWIDERRDPYKSTRVAASYLRDLYEQFGSWEMALAAYNYGPTAVQRTINRWSTKDYWEIFLPRETEDFVPKIMASILIAKEPLLFGFDPIESNPYEYRDYKVKNSVDIRQVARLAEIDIKEIQLLNPELRRMITPPGVEYNLRLPAESYETFTEAFESLPESETYLSQEEIDRLVRRVEYYRVRRGDSLWNISARYNVSVQNIMKWNNLSTSSIYPNQRLKIYIRGG
ncbi:MAG: transglycosylase SLT domain-containing protein [Elusimicrobiota bacterium]